MSREEAAGTRRDPRSSDAESTLKQFGLTPGSQGQNACADRPAHCQRPGPGSRVSVGRSPGPQSLEQGRVGSVRVPSGQAAGHSAQHAPVCADRRFFRPAVQAAVVDGVRTVSGAVTHGRVVTGLQSHPVPFRHRRHVQCGGGGPRGRSESKAPIQNAVTERDLTPAADVSKNEISTRPVAEVTRQIARLHEIGGSHTPIVCQPDEHLRSALRAGLVA